jgi:hypothetical protein
LKKFAKIALNHKIEEVVEIEEVVKIVVNHKIEEEVIWALGWDFRVDFGVHFWAEFWFRFWGPFLPLFWSILNRGFACFTGLFGPRGWFLALF